MTYAESGLVAGSELSQPVFQGLLVRGFNRAESNSHSCRSRIRDIAQRNKRRSTVINSDTNLRSTRKRCRRFDKASKDAQIAGDGHDLFFRLHIHDFRPGRKGVACRAMLFDLHNLEYEPLSPAA